MSDEYPFIPLIPSSPYSQLTARGTGIFEFVQVGVKGTMAFEKTRSVWRQCKQAMRDIGDYIICMPAIL